MIIANADSCKDTERFFRNEACESASATHSVSQFLQYSRRNYYASKTFASNDSKTAGII